MEFIDSMKQLEELNGNIDPENRTYHLLELKDEFGEELSREHNEVMFSTETI